ncbi:hypothetical protein TVAG_176490 [Trichomonas vaginalis G3]|uniref:Glycosyltransferase 61 catalytic domain-containing protein n=1 Tax=Trichomonas vaginalis (strain ATCC PRA-98 / G3) TaxID=412133 RepID=A2FTH2_TRIV3|nr:glycosyltransferase family [Trichomonas vaginalis G3]EAX91790.1 hypothetical protein TVAG_176490 [Trichomonas vaginalis G3]KAI5549036.1 glycosyltransferase family [Trichomonas vaginalis G3]|eukprot:XP_001304720.1 hypothetical protein [Trichomonas vaginalis G3]
MVFWFDLAEDTFDYDISHPRGDHNYPPRFGEHAMVDFWSNFTARYTLYKNVFVNGNSCIFNGTHIIDPHFCTGPFWLNQYYEGKVVKYINIAVIFGHRHSKISFGHFTHDYMFPFIMTPDEVLKYATIILPDYTIFGYDYMTIFGYRNKVYCLKEGTWAYCSQVLIPTHPRPHNSHFGESARKLSCILREKLNLKKIKPTRYVFMNRYNSRVVSNLQHLYNLTVSRYPDIKWEYEIDKQGSLLTYGKLFSQFKVLVYPNGSNMLKCIFMEKDSLVLDINNEMWDLPMFGTLPAIGIKMIVIFNKEYQRFCTKGNIDQNQFMRAIDVAYYYIVNQHFPEPTNGLSFIDYKFNKCNRFNIISKEA